MSKRFLAILLAAIMCLGSTSTAFASEQVFDGCELGNISDENSISPQTISGTETWSKDSDFSAKFTFYGNNLTPVKTIGRTGYYKIYIDFDMADIGSSTPVRLRTQIRDAYSSSYYKDLELGPTTSFSDTLPAVYLTKGTKIQISFRVLDKDGNYDANRKMKMRYGYYYTAPQ